MNNNTENQEELDAFFDLLLPLLPKKLLKEAPPPSQKLFDLAWESAKAHHDHLWQNGFYHETIYPPLAAADGTHQKNAPIRFECLKHQGIDKGILTFERIPGNEDEQILSFKCKEEFVTEFEGCHIEVEISGQKYELGVVDWYGETEPKKVPCGIYLQQIEVFKK